MKPPHLVIAGASGFLGRSAAQWFAHRGWAVTTLSRRDPQLPGTRHLSWDGRQLGAWVSELNGAEALLNFAGRSVNCRYHARNREEIKRSRVETTALLGRAIGCCVQPPRHWLNASTATIYRHAEDRPMNEREGELGEGFSVDVARTWEAALFDADTPTTRKTALRTSMVLGWGRNSVYPTLRRLVRTGLGGPQGNGRQRVSWIHLEDFCRALEFLLSHPLDGIVNVTAPEPVTNREFMHAMRASLRVPFGLPCPRPLLALGAWMMRTEPELVLKSRWVTPNRLLRAGFHFRFPSMDQALADLRSEQAGQGPNPKQKRPGTHAPGLEDFPAVSTNGDDERFRRALPHREASQSWKVRGRR